MARDPHYTFAHRALPHHLFSDPAAFCLSVRAGEDPISHLWPGVTLQQQHRELEGVGELLVVTMPPTKTPAQAIHVAVLMTEAPRYFTIEFASGDDPSMLGEWRAQQRIGHGPGPVPTVENFLDSIREIVKSANLATAFELAEFHATLEEAAQVLRDEPIAMTFNKFVACHSALMFEGMDRKAFYSALKLRWWSPRRRRAARSAYLFTMLLALSDELLRQFPEEKDAIGMAIAMNYATRMNVKIESLPDVDPQRLQKTSRALCEQFANPAREAAVLAVLQAQQRTLEKSAALFRPIPGTVVEL